MMYKLLVFLLILLGGCASHKSIDCEALLEIDTLPMKVSYGELLQKYGIADSIGLQSCLASNITNTEPAKDPRGAPVVLSYVRGDNAFFILVMKYDWNIEEFLDEPHRQLWRDQGVFSYFDYVSIQANRQSLSNKVQAELAAPE
jgi:hypothetical protein